MKQQITQERLKKLFDYNPETGLFKRRKKSGRYPHKTGKVNKNGYVGINISNVSYLGHRLAWLYVYGYFPENDIDHIDRNKTNNKISNLREVSKSCNKKNCDLQSNNTSGFKGVWWNKKEEVWEVQITSNRVPMKLGRSKNKEEAICLRLAGEQACNWDTCESKSLASRYVKNHIQNNGIMNQERIIKHAKQLLGENNV